MNAQQLKNSILQEAIMGRLVPQDPNDEPASVLLDKIREEKKRLVKEGKLKKKDLEETPISEDERPFEIPESWEWVRIKTIFDVCSARRVHEKDWRTSGIPFYRAREIGKLADNGFVDNDLFIDQQLYDEFSQSGVPKEGDLMITAVGTLGKVYIVKEGEIFYYKDGSVLCMENKWRINPQYAKYVIESPVFINQYIGESQGTTVATLTMVRVNQYLFPLPPLAEQKRIVAKIEELLPKIDEYGKAQEALDKLNEELPEKLKKSILQEAIEGRLVPQDPNDEPASVLLDKIRKEKARLVKEGKLKKKDLEETPIEENEIPFKIPESWEWCKLGTIAALIGGFAFKSHEYTSSGSRVIRISDITENGFINKNIVRFPFTDKLSQYVILEGDILMAMTGGTVGKSLYVKYLPEETMLLNQRVALIRPNIVFTDYIDYVIKSQHIQGIITEAKNSTNDNISMGDIFNFPIPLPPLSEQKRIVAKIEELMHEIDKLKV